MTNSQQREVLEALIEREGLSMFLRPQEYTHVEDLDIGLYELDNGRYGVILEIFPPHYTSAATEHKIEEIIKMDLPASSSINLFVYTSKNLNTFMHNFKEMHKGYKKYHKIPKPEALEKAIKARADFLEKGTTVSIFKDRAIEYRLRNFINLASFTFPMEDEDGNELDKSEVVNIISKILLSLSDFAPRNFSRSEYIALMREILNRGNSNRWNVSNDSTTPIPKQIVNNDTIVHIGDRGVLEIGSFLTQDEYEEFKDKIEKNSQYKKTGKKKEKRESIFSTIIELFKKDVEKEEKKEDDNENFLRAKDSVVVMTPKVYPDQANLYNTLSRFIDYFGNKLEPTIPSDFMLSMTVYKEKAKSAVNTAMADATWNITQEKGINMEIFTNIGKRINESKKVLRALNNGHVPIKAMWSVSIFEQDPFLLRKAVESVHSAFREAPSWELQEETMIPLLVFLYSLPLNFDAYFLKKTQRLNTMFQQNAAQIAAPVLAGSRGVGYPVLTYGGRLGEIISLDLFANDKYNFIISGGSGSGKSYLANDLVQNYISAGAKIRIFDQGGSYKSLTRILGGDYIVFKNDGSFCLNPFTDAESENGRIKNKDNILNLIMLMAGVNIYDKNLKGDEIIKMNSLKSMISEAIDDAFEKKNNSAGIADVLIALKRFNADYQSDTNSVYTELRDLIQALTPFGTPDGQYFHLFNGEANMRFTTDFSVIELQEIASDPVLKTIVLAAVSSMIDREFFLGDREQKKLMIIDEAWTIMEDPIILAFLEKMSRTIRKHNGGLGIITQHMTDFNKSDITRELYSSASTKFILKQDEDTLVRVEKEEYLPSAIVSLVKTLKQRKPLFSEVLILSGENMFVARHFTDPVSHWLFTNSPDDMIKVREVMNNYDLDEVSSRIAIGTSIKMKKTLQATVYSLIEAGEIELQISQADVSIKSKLQDI